MITGLRLLVIALLALPAAIPAASETTSPLRPNILLLTADDLGPYLGCYGDPYVKTPHIDELASRGVKFTNAYVTQASCSPSRSSILSGLYPHQNGQIGLAHRGYSMKNGIPLLPDMLRPAGYRSGLIGKYHVGKRDGQPFDVMIEPNKLKDSRDPREYAPHVATFLKETTSPFFLMVSFIDPHRPLPPQVAGFPKKPLTGNDVKPFPWLAVDTPEVREEVANYYNAVMRVDTAVGLVLDELEKAGHTTDTLIMFIGDHGPPFTRGKTTNYEAGLKIPFLYCWPGRAFMDKSDPRLVSTVDIVPTLLGAAHVSVPDGLPGRSFLTVTNPDPRLLLISNPEPFLWRDLLFSEYTVHEPQRYYPRRAVRDLRYKLIHNLLPERPNPSRDIDGCRAYEAGHADNVSSLTRQVYKTYENPGEFEVYDLEADPYEFHNLAGDPATSAVEAKLKSALDQWRRDTHDPLRDSAELARLTKQHEDAKPNRKEQRRDDERDRRMKKN